MQLETIRVLKIVCVPFEVRTVSVNIRLDVTAVGCFRFCPESLSKTEHDVEMVNEHRLRFVQHPEVDQQSVAWSVA